MTDYTGSFELRKVVVKFTRTPGGGVTEDAAAFTVHLAKITSGAIDANWVTLDYTNAEARLDTFWTTMKAKYLSNIALSGYTWYKDSNVYSPPDRADGPSNPATRSTVRNVVGTSTGTTALPPQVAFTVTKLTDIRKRWGRLYLPAMDGGYMGLDGRLASGTMDSTLAAAVVLFNGWRTDGLKAVVFSRGRSAHPDASGATIAAHDATAYEITSLQMDNIADVIRSRRWAHPTRRTATVLT